MLKLQRVHELTEDNIKDTILYLDHIRSKEFFNIKLDEALEDIVTVIADIYRKADITDYDTKKSAYLVFNRLN